MAEIRFNYGDKFTQTTNTNTGIGSTIPAAKLDIAGGTSAGSLRVSGIATLSSYQGFVNTKLSTTEDLIVEAGQSGSVSGEVVVGTGQTISVSTGATTGQGGIQSLKVYKTFMPPVGGTADRPTDVKPGMLYYNKDFKTIEFWDGNFWKQVDNTIRTGRAVVGGGVAPGSDYTSMIQHFNLSTFGNATSFGNLSNGGRFCIGSASDGIRGIFYAGQEGPSSPRDFIDEITMASEGDSVDFGDASSSGRCFGGCGNSTRGIFGGINAGNPCDSIQFATRGSTIGSFITFSVSGGNKNAMFCSPVKLVNRSGENTGAVGSGHLTQNVAIETATIATGGNTTLFGAISRRTRQVRGTSNNVRGLFFGGYGAADPYPTVNHIDYVTIASNGNAIDFGDLTVDRSQGAAIAHSTRAVFAGGSGTPTTVNTIEKVEIATAGQAQDFGDLFRKVSATHGCSDSGGGLGGF